MSPRCPSAGFLIWLGLLVLTTANWALMEAGLGQFPFDHRVLGSAIVLLALFKVRLIMRHFMEVREAPHALGWLMDGWLVVVLISVSIQLWLKTAA